MRILLIAATLAGLGAAPAAWAGKYDPDRLKACDFEIERLTIEEVARQVRPEDLIAKYKLVTPILPPRLGKEQVEALIAAEISLRVEALYPQGKLQEIQRSANERYRLYKVGDQVTIKVKDIRMGHWLTLTKFIREISDKGIRLGDQYFIFPDIDPTEYCHFKKTEHDNAVEAMITHQTAVFTKGRATCEAELKRSLARQIWQAEGYIYRRTKRAWVPREEVFGYLYQEAWKKKYAEVRETMVTKVMDEHGFAWNEDLARYEVREEAVTPGGAGEEPGTAPGNKSTMEEWKEKLEKLLKGHKPGDDIWNEKEDGADEPPAEDKGKDAAPKAGEPGKPTPKAGEPGKPTPKAGEPGKPTPKKNGAPKGDEAPAAQPATTGEKIKSATDKKQEALFGGD